MFVQSKILTVIAHIIFFMDLFIKKADKLNLSPV